MILTQKEIINMAETFLRREYTDVDISHLLYGIDAGSGRMTALLLYLLILQNEPCNILEFSPSTGFSTAALGLAMKVRSMKNRVLTFELEEKRRKLFYERMNKLDLNDYVECIWGDALVEIPKILKERNLIGDIDFCFVDSGHSKEFSRRYTKEIFPLLSPNCIICIHDITSVNGDPHGQFETNMYGDHATEWIGVKEWIEAGNYEYTLTHPIFGGKEERSKEFPINRNLYDVFDRLLNIDFVRNDSKQPMMLITDRSQK